VLALSQGCPSPPRCSLFGGLAGGDDDDDGGDGRTVHGRDPLNKLAVRSKGMGYRAQATDLTELVQQTVASQSQNMASSIHQMSIDVHHGKL
jgi:hypothetical protein